MEVDSGPIARPLDSPASADAWKPGRFGRRALCLVLALGCVVAVPFVVTSFWLNVLVIILFAALGAQALNFLVGVVGQVSVGNAAFMAVGAFCAYQVHDLFGAGLIAGVIAGGLSAAALGALASFPAFRLRGFYLALSTIALVVVVGYVLQNIQHAQVGVSGYQLPRPTFAGFEFRSDTAWYFILCASLAGMTAGFHLIARGRFGRAAAIVREKENIAPVFGIYPRRVKAASFVATSALIGMQGVLFAYYVGFFSADQFTLLLSVQYLAMMIIGGIAHPLGGILGAAFVVGLPLVFSELARWDAVAWILGSQSNNFALLAYGSMLVIVLLRAPQGIVGLALSLFRLLGMRTPTPIAPAPLSRNKPLPDRRGDAAC